MSLADRAISKIKRIATEQVAGSPMGALTARNINGNYILMYHGVTATGNTQFNRRHTALHCFRKQIRFLKRHCAVISVDDFFKGRFVPEKPNFAITFDDGYLNNFTYAKPVLEEFKCPATFYITGLNQIQDNILWADYVNIASILCSADIEIEGELFLKKGNTYFSKQSGRSLYDIIKHQKAGYSYKQKVRDVFQKQVNFQNQAAIKEYWQLMNDQQITEASRSAFITIGSHGYYHNNLGTVSHEDALNELQLSKKYLEGLVQYPVSQLAYPDGSYTPTLIQAAGQMGFEIQLAADQFLFKEDDVNFYLKKRCGIYTVDSCINQVLGAIRTSL